MAALFLRPPVHRQSTVTPAAGHLEVVLPTIGLVGIKRGKISPISAIVARAAASAATGVVGGDSQQAKDESLSSYGGGDGGDYKTTDEIKSALAQALQGINRGIFGVTSAKKSEIMKLLELLEAGNPTPHPTENLLDKVDGCWKLAYSTITILGVKRTKLGLRDFITLGDFFQTIDVAKEKAVNVIKFNARGLRMLTGQLTIEASFSIASKTRVDIKLENSSITPDQLLNLFQKNYDLLLAIFNPEGWLEITYVDDSMRIGRDDKGNIFVLERTEQEKV